MWEVIQWNKIEWPYITIGSVCSLLMGAAMPLFAILFGEIVEVLSLEDSDEVRRQANMYSLFFVLTGILVGGSTFFQVSDKTNVFFNWIKFNNFKFRYGPMA